MIISQLIFSLWEMSFLNLEVIGALNHHFYIPIKMLLKSHLLISTLRLIEISNLEMYMLEFHTGEVLMEHNLQMEILLAAKNYNTLLL